MVACNAAFVHMYDNSRSPSQHPIKCRNPGGESEDQETKNWSFGICLGFALLGRRSKHRAQPLQAIDHCVKPARQVDNA